MVRFAIATCAVCLLVLGRPASVASQHDGTPARRPTRVPVTIALADTTSAEPAYRIIRRADQPPYDVIVLSGHADAATLSAAVSDLLLVRTAQGDTATHAGLARVRRRRPDAHGARAPRFPWTQRVLEDLRRAAPREIAGAGNVRAVEIWLPPQRPRAARG
jgi:hypothetical protein